MMFTGSNQHGHEADGAETNRYCRWCYDDGKYTYETTMEDMIEECAPRMSEAMGWPVVSRFLHLLRNPNKMMSNLLRISEKIFQRGWF